MFYRVTNKYQGSTVVDVEVFINNSQKIKPLFLSVREKEYKIMCLQIKHTKDGDNEKKIIYSLSGVARRITL